MLIHLGFDLFTYRSHEKSKQNKATLSASKITALKTPYVYKQEHNLSIDLFCNEFINLFAKSK